MPVKRVLVTGMSGVGKTTLLDELAARGHRAVDTDYGDYFEVVDGEQLWRRDRIEALLRQSAWSGESAGSAESDEPGAGKALFVQGTVRNQGSFYPWFDHIVLLSAPVEVMLERIRTRTTNPFGKDPAERARILEDVATVEPLLRASATLEVITTMPVSDVADAVLAHIGIDAGD